MVYFLKSKFSNKMYWSQMSLLNELNLPRLWLTVTGSGDVHNAVVHRGKPCSLGRSIYLSAMNWNTFFIAWYCLILLLQWYSRDSYSNCLLVWLKVNLSPVMFWLYLAVQCSAPDTVQLQGVQKRRILVFLPYFIFKQQDLYRLYKGLFLA